MGGQAHIEGVEVESQPNGLCLRLVGDWTIYQDRPGFDELWSGPKDAGPVDRVTIDCCRMGTWDSRLLVFILQARGRSKQEGWHLVLSCLPDGVQRLLEQVPEEPRTSGPAGPKGSLPNRLGRGAQAHFQRARDISTFAGEIVVGVGHLLSRPSRFRWGDCLEVMQQTGARALPIVGLISFLVGVIMAFQAAIQLRQFGAEVFVANLVGLAVVREMGPMMAAVVLCGRTGAAFAAQIGTMRVNEEIDALKTLGASPIDFLVMPRMAALFVMMPLLVIYANFLGILGGLFIAVTTMDMTVATYFAQTREAIGLMDVYTGLIKAVAFGVLIAFSGCLRGLQCKRSSAGVGAAATSAVVTGILLVIVADALFAVIFDRLGL
jgi:phospholipid/cholesterol/gamma-HCH transport system permease protein